MTLLHGNTRCHIIEVQAPHWIAVPVHDEGPAVAAKENHEVVPRREASHDMVVEGAGAIDGDLAAPDLCRCVGHAVNLHRTAAATACGEKVL